MVLNDKWIRDHQNIIDHFNEKCVNPASLDLCWSGRIRYTLSGDDVIDSLDRSISLWGDIQERESVIIYPGELVLLDTMEFIKVPKDICGIIMLKSSIGRFGLEHLHAGFFDPGFEGTATLEIFNSSPRKIRIHKGQPIIQIVFFKLNEVPEKDYSITGRYNGQNKPQESK